jgi:hypothetical protein
MSHILRSIDEAEIPTNPDAVLFREEESAALLQRLTFYTVPIWFFPSGDPVGGRPGEIEAEVGSGVLLEIAAEHFILTAGHCVEHYQKFPSAFGVENSPHRYMPGRSEHSKFVCENDSRESGKRDFGYIHISPDQVVRFRGNRVFVSLDRVAVLTSEELRGANDWIAASGYPRALTGQTTRGHFLRLLAPYTVVAGVCGAPQSDLTPLDPQGLEFVDLWLPPEMKVPVLRGMSGGGCWKTNVRPARPKWSDGDIKLTGIHIASTDDSQKDRFMREVLIGHHLKLIARGFPNLRSEIFGRWPQLEDDQRFL